ncbi:MAG: CDP-alcohol phosphatidyltransferase family protein [Candidatus Marinimicrobia bacterium]|nr:CDP-alcohol phosphatidyltransferase family protein [Candidatus Neomarinimicrobiota bacterium]
MKHFNLPNLISISRILLTVPCLMFFDAGDNYPGLLMLALMIVSDYADGILARRMKIVSDFGKALDPLSDKIVTVILISYLILEKSFPIWFVSTLIFRDIILSYLGLKVKKKTGVMPQANMAGKIGLNGIAIMIIGWFMDWEWMKLFGLWGSVVIILYSSVVYFRDYYKLLRIESLSKESQ